MTVLQHTLAAGEGFFENDYLSVGINAFGAFGTANNAPGGYPTGGSSRLGMFGYAVDPADRDAIMPGLPFDAFTVAHDGTNYTNASIGGGPDQITGSLKDLSTSAMDKAKWSSAAGQAGGLQVQQTVTMNPTDHYTTIKVTLKNTTGAAMHNVDYLKSVDPDQTAGTYNTNNVVFAQAGGSKPVHGVAGYTVDDAGAFGSVAFFLYTKDAHATAAVHGDDTNAYDTGLLGQAQGSTDLNDDTANNLLFQFGNLAAGASVSFTYYEGVTDSLTTEIANLGNRPTTFGANGDDNLDYSTSSAKVKVDAGHGNDFVHGTAFNDFIQAGEGQDLIIGGAGNDTLMGGAGDDFIYGDSNSTSTSTPGQDVLYGGAGSDYFYFFFTTDSKVSKPDQIMDFSHSQADKIDLFFIDANTTVSGDQAFTFIGTNAFSHHAGQLNEVAVPGGYDVQGDVNGDGVADFAIFVANHTAPLVASDFDL